MDESRAGYQKLLTDISVERLSDQIDYESICRSVDQFINGLTQREQMIIRTRYCLQAEKFKTLQQIGDIFGVTRERMPGRISTSPSISENRPASTTGW